MRHAIAMLLLLTATAHADGFAPGTKVLAIRGSTNSYYAATVKTASDDGGSVTYLDGTVQEFGPITFPVALRAYDWKIGSELQCAADAKAAAAAGEDATLTAGKVTAIDAATVELDGKAKFPLAACRHHRTWWDEVSPFWRDYASYKTIKALPKAGAKDPNADEITSAFSFFLSSADGGSYIVIKKCVATGKGWVKMNSGDELTARTVDVACGIALPLPPKPREMFTCMIQYGVCRQPYQGDGVYGGCEWHNADRDPDQISCAALK